MKRTLLTMGGGDQTVLSRTIVLLSAYEPEDGASLLLEDAFSQTPAP